jgi:[NiFe] hydrogenase diaphorase moiety small subunit
MSEELSFTLDGQRFRFRTARPSWKPRGPPASTSRICASTRISPRMAVAGSVWSRSMAVQASCTTPAVAGQVVQSETEELRDIRRGILQMMFVEGNHVCPACEKSGACQLQAVAYYVGMLAPHYTHFYPHRVGGRLAPGCSD